MKLIDADALKVNLDKTFSFGSDNKFKLFNQIDEQPTAYDADRVVRELEKLQKETFSYAFKYNHSFYDGQLRGVDKAIEIVKVGSENDN